MKSNKLITWLIVIAVVLAIILAGAIGVTWYRAVHVFVEGEAYPVKAQSLDLREKDISFQHYDALQAQLPNCMGLVGKEVTAARLSKAGDAIKSTGTVTKVSLVDGKFEFYIGGDEKPFTYDQLMEIKPQKDAGEKIAETVDKISKDIESIKRSSKEERDFRHEELFKDQEII